jgi:protein TonB
MNDVIFEKRNKRYGAYELRVNYHRRLFKSFVAASISLMAVFLISFFTRKEVKRDLSKIITETVFVSDPIEVEQFSTPKAPEHFTAPPPEVTPPDPNSFVAVTDSVTEPLDTSTQQSASDPLLTDTGADTGSSRTGDTTQFAGLPSGGAVRNEAMVDVRPDFPGGMDKFYAYLLSRIRFTNIALDERVQGRMYVKFIVDEQGMISNVTVVKRLGYGLDEQVAKVLTESPKWSPGIVRNTAVKTEMVLPVNFHIK